MIEPKSMAVVAERLRGEAKPHHDELQKTSVPSASSVRVLLPIRRDDVTFPLPGENAKI